MLSSLERGVVETTGSVRDCSRNVGKIGGAFESGRGVYGHGECPRLERRERGGEDLRRGEFVERITRANGVADLHATK